MYINYYTVPVRLFSLLSQGLLIHIVLLSSSNTIDIHNTACKIGKQHYIVNPISISALSSVSLCSRKILSQSSGHSQELHTLAKSGVILLEQVGLLAASFRPFRFHRSQYSETTPSKKMPTQCH